SPRSTSVISDQSVPSRTARRVRKLECVNISLGFLALFRLKVARQAQTRELPACRGSEEVAVRRADVGGGRRTGASAQHQLVDHELAVVLPQRARQRLEAGIGAVGGARPLPNVSEHLQQLRVHRSGTRCMRGYGMPVAGLDEVALPMSGGMRASAGGDLPFHLRRQARLCPTRKGI